MVIDDRKSMRSFVIDVLREVGVGKIVNADSYAQAIKMIDPPEGIEDMGTDFDINIDIVLIDWLLGDGESGLDLLKWIRSHKSEMVKYLPVIMLSGYSEKDNIEKARDAGANEFLTKPISISRLLNRILRVVETPRPFIASDVFFGPDRRRHNIPVETDRRKQKPKEEVQA